MSVRRILHVIPSVGVLRGGPSAMVRSLAHDQSREGLDTHIATTDDNGPERLDVPHGQPVVQDGVTYWFFPRQTRAYTFSWPLSRWLAAHVQDFDLIHIHALFSYATLPAAYWATRRGVPYVVRPLGTLNEWGMQHRRPWLKRLSFRLLESRVLKHAAFVHYTSERERFEAEKLPVKGRARVIPNGVHPLAIRQTNAADSFHARYPHLRDRQVVLFLSRIDRKKGLDLLIRAFADIRRQSPSALLVIAGDGPADLVSELKGQAMGLGLAGDMLWLGFLAGADKDAALAAAAVFVLPSYSENFGIAVVEAMAAAKPVVVSDQVAIQDEVTRAGAGLVTSCDAPALAEAVVRLLKDSSLRDGCGERGAALVREHYSSEAVTRRIIGAYNAIAS